MSRFLAVTLIWLLANDLVSAAPLGMEQLEVQTFIKSLYGIPARTFEAGQIDGKYDPGKVKKTHFVRYFSDQIIATIKDPSHVEGGGFIRHPALDGEDISGNGSETPSITPKILPAIVRGNSAYVDVYPDTSGRTIFFLTKTPTGWRIANTASYSVWPTRNDGTCWEPFYLLKPTPEQLALETKECIKYRQSQASKK